MNTRNIAMGLKTAILAGALVLSVSMYAGAAESIGDVAKQEVQDVKTKAADLTREAREKVAKESISAKEEKQSMGEYIGDAAVTAKVKAKFLEQKGLDSLDIKVTTVDGAVTLMGDVDNTAQVGLAESVAKDVEGVDTVNNLLGVKPITN